ncbi:Acetylornithine transaminase [Clostridium sp. DL-VIII]|uniref:aminotransferase class III-fold pyridoxal phosphate-dependent enzyme n=1 Tax=Clostridium sp. DL-VIII TaxID=641107 RepID=UPI00023B052A|nr:aminotransferase class III-fold pyridoxal phosphate-dependent enzyme [Clostridium sp. DL-VIII]EHJ00821.1 Acetylornithine transaminase [Clostridium sp. DL-VIII]
MAELIKTKNLRMFNSPGISITVKRAQGTKIYTEEYGELIDLQAGCWAAVLGHCRKEIAETLSINAQLLFHTHEWFTTEHPAALVSEISSAAKLRYSYRGTFISSGSDAVSLAVTLSELLTKKSQKLCLSISSLGSSPELRMPRDQKVWIDLPINKCLSCKKKCDCRECGKFNEINFKNIAAFVFEPGNSGGLVLCPPEKLIEFLCEKVRNAGGLIIANEVTTGFGRTGKWFGFQHYECFNSEEHSPDFISMGKGLGNGYPISGILVKSKLAEAIEDSKFKYVQSHIDDPLGCIVSRKVIEIMLENNLVERGNKAGEYLQCKLHELAEITGEISEILGRGMMIAIALDKNLKAKEIFLKLLKKGFFTGYSEMYNIIRLYPPLILNYSEIDNFCFSLKDILLNN